MVAAGCMKLPIAVSLIKAVEDKKVDFMDKIKIEKEDKVYGTGIIHEFNEREYTIFELLVAMLIQSDNTAANKIIDIIGMDNINSNIKEMGLKNTILNRKTSDERKSKEGVENITSAYDLSKIWKHLHNATYLNRDNSTMLVDILRRQQIKNKLAKGNFVFTVLSTSVPNSVYGTVTLAKCGKMMWDNVMNNWH